jgi:hypothetical protein
VQLNRQAARAIAFEIGTTAPGESLADQSKNFAPQINADKGIRV